VTAVRWSAVVTAVTAASMSAAVGLSVGWLLSAPGASRFEPAVSMFGLVAGLTGALAQRRAAARERRVLVLTALADELGTDAVLLAGLAAPAGGRERRRVHPRLPISAVDVALTSGVLDGPADAGLVRQLHRWRTEVSGLNRRLELSELLAFVAPRGADAGQFERAVPHRDSYLQDLREQLRMLRDELTGALPAGSARWVARPVRWGPVRWAPVRRPGAPAVVQIAAARVAS
jgi:hypothetical protein